MLDALEVYCQLHDPGRRRTAAIGDFLRIWNATHSDRPTSRATLYGHLKQRREQGHVLPAYATGSKEQDVPKEIGDLVGRWYLDRNQRTLTVCYEIARVECERDYPHLLGQFPSISTIRTYVRRRWPRQAIILARKGDTAFRQQCLPYIEMDPRDYEVMDLWTSDNRVLDIWFANLEGHRARPWVTDWRDKRSTFRVSWLIHEGPTAETALATFAMGARRYGLPRGLQLDNDRIYSTPAFAGAKGSRRWKVHMDEARVKGLLDHLRWLEDGVEHQVTIHWTIPRQPRGKGSHETQYRHQDAEWFDKLWGVYCGRDPNSRPEHLKTIKRRKDGLPSLPEVQYLFGIHAAGMNHKASEAQDLQGRTPAEAFAAADYVKRTATDAALRLLFMRASKPRRVGQNGIWLFDRWYWSEGIAGHFGEQVYVRYDLDEIGRLYAFTLQDQYIDTLERTDLLSRRASAADARKAHHKQKFVRRIAQQAAEVRAETAANPDLVRHLAESRERSYAAQGKEVPRPDRPRKVTQLIPTPFDAAATAIEGKRAAGQAAAAGRKSREATEDRLYREAMDRQREAQSSRPSMEEVEEKLDKLHQISKRFGG